MHSREQFDILHPGGSVQSSDTFDEQAGGHLVLAADTGSHHPGQTIPGPGLINFIGLHVLGADIGITGSRKGRSNQTEQEDCRARRSGELHGRLVRIEDVVGGMSAGRVVRSQLDLPYLYLV